MDCSLKTCKKSKQIFISKNPNVFKNLNKVLGFKNFWIVYCVFLLIGIGIGFCKIFTFKLLHDEVYELARANGNSINRYTQAYPFNLKKEIISAQSIIELQKKNYQKIDLVDDIVHYSKNFYKYTNHPPVNSICAKFFILKQSSIANLRKFGFVTFIFFLASTYLFVNSLGLASGVGLITISLLANMTLINCLSHFGKGYSLGFAFMLLSMTFFNKYQSNDKKKNLIISFLFFHLALLTHYFTGSIGLIMMIALLYLHPKQKIIELGIFALSLIFYIPLFTGQVMESNDFFDNHQGTNEFYNFIYNSFQMISLNYRYPLDLVIGAIILFLIYVGIKSKPDRLNWILITCSILPFLFFLLIDFTMNKHLLMIIRYELFAFVFFAILMAKILIQKPKIIGFAIITISLINLINPNLQKHYGILNSATKEIFMGMSFNVELLNKRTLIILKDMNGNDLTFINHLLSNILNQHPLAEINPEVTKSNLQIQNLFFASKDIKKDKLKSLIKKNNIEQVFKI
jgi:hypothetical protein